MSADAVVNTSLDFQMEVITNFLISLIPKPYLLKALVLYTWACDLWQMFMKQASRSSSALFQSFSDETIYFLKNSNNLAVKQQGLPEPVWVASEYQWTYYPSRNLFVEKDHEQSMPKRISWLSADLKCEEYLFADLTLWLEKIRYQGAQPPNDILVQGWALDHNRAMGPLKDFTLHVLTEDAEELVMPVRAI